MLSAIGSSPRLRIMRLLLAAHPTGLVAGEIGTELGIPGATLSHHLGKLKNTGLVTASRDGTFLWYRVNTESMTELLRFLFADCRLQRPQEMPALGNAVSELSVLCSKLYEDPT